MSLKDITTVEIKQPMTECSECKVQSYSGHSHASTCSKYQKGPPGSIAWMEAQEKEAARKAARPTPNVALEAAQDESERLKQANDKEKPDEMVTISAKKLEAMQAELEAVHSDLGDASQTVFDLLEAIKQKEIELQAERNKVHKLEESVNRLKGTLARLKAGLADSLKVI